MSSAKKLVGWYKAAALMVFNTLVIFTLINLAISLFFGVQRLFRGRDKSDPLTQAHGGWNLKAVYPDLSEAEVLALQHETRTRTVGYTPFAQFKETAFQGHYVNVDAAGFRLVRNQGPWPPQAKNFNVFVFGGSTTFGFGVKDEQTIPSYLQEKLSATLKQPVCVYNFGSAFYYSSQERVRFQNLLLQGAVPNLAVFVDGPNDFYYPDDMPEYSDEFGQMLSGEYLRKHRYDFISRLPIMKAVRTLTGAEKVGLAANSWPAESDETLKIMAKTVLGRYWANLKLTGALASARDVRTCFVWQPVPMYKFDLKNHPTPVNGFGRHNRSAWGYEYMSSWLQTNAPPTNFLDLADFQEHRDEPLYVDNVHYSAHMCDMLAVEIARFLTDHHLTN